MPRVPDSELGRYLDPESEEYSPGKGDIDEEERAADILGQEFAQIEDELTHPKRDFFTGKDDKFQASDPDDLWGRLTYLKEDYLGKVRDKKLKLKLKEQFSALEQQIYKQYIPFIEAQINFYAWENSPLEERNDLRSRKSDLNDIAGYFSQARKILQHFKFPKEQEVGYLSELDRLEEKLNRYRSEATLFTFEDKEEKLQKELREYFDFDSLPKHQETEEKVELRFDLWLTQAHSLIEIADRMLHAEIKSRCILRANFVLKDIKFLKVTWKVKGGKKNADTNYGHFARDIDMKGADWAWTLLGIDRNSSKEDLKKAYHSLALKYHPDYNKDKEAEEKMKKINEAVSFIKRVRGYK